MVFGIVWIRKPHHPLFDGWSHSCEVSKADTHSGQTQRVLGTVVGDTSSTHNTNSYYRNPTFYHMGTLDPLGKACLMSLTMSGYTPMPLSSCFIPMQKDTLNPKLPFFLDTYKS